MQWLAKTILRGRVEAAMIASTLAMLSLRFPFLSVLSLISSAAIALVALRKGIRDGVSVLLIGLIALVGFCGVILGAQALTFGMIYGLALWLPVFLCGVILRETRQLSVAIELLLLLGGMCILFAYLVLGSPAETWYSLFKPLGDKLVASSGSQFSASEVQSSLQALAKLMTGVAASSVVATLLLSLMLARWWQSILFNPGGFRDEFLGFQGHRITAYVTTGLLVLVWLAPDGIAEIAANLGILCAVLYVMVGTSVLHRFFAATRWKFFLLTLLYVGMLLVPHVLLPIAFIGFSDTWVNWRNRKALT